MGRYSDYHSHYSDYDVLRAHAAASLLPGEQIHGESECETGSKELIKFYKFSLNNILITIS